MNSLANPFSEGKNQYQRSVFISICRLIRVIKKIKTGI
jgi:hypothetical protein